MVKITKLPKNPSEILFKIHERQKQKEQKNQKKIQESLGQSKHNESILKIKELYDTQQYPEIPMKHQVNLRPLYVKLIEKKQRLNREEFENLKKIYSDITKRD